MNTNILELTTNEIVLITQPLPPFAKVNTGDTLHLEIELNVTEEIDVIWEFNRKILYENDEVKFIQNGAFHYLLISNVKVENQGIYEVFVGEGEDEISCSCKVYVDDDDRLPLASLKLPNHSKSLSHQTNVTSFNDINDISDKNNRKYERDVDNHEMINFNEKSKSSLSEKPHLNQKQSNTENPKQLLIGTKDTRTKITPVIIEKCDINQNLLVGEDIQLSVEILTGDSSSLKVEWHKGHKVLSKQPGISILDNNLTLIIKDSKVTDAGSYKCIVTNKYGSCAIEFNVKISGFHFVY